MRKTTGYTGLAAAAALSIGAGLAVTPTYTTSRQPRRPRQAPEEIKAAAVQYRAEREAERLKREQPIMDAAAARRERRLAKRREIINRNR